jgi:uncharacterized protein (TIGR04562 family)
MNDKAFLADFWRFPWPIMDVLIAGKSSIDLPELRKSDWSEATEFVRGYGYDPEDPQDLMKLHAVLVEAIAFIEDKLVGPREWSRGIRPPDQVLACEDPRHLIVWASSTSPEERLLRAWACAVLRVMHTIIHIEGVTRMASLAVARDQIMTRFNKYIMRDADKSLWLGEGDQRIRLERVEWKHHKTRHSIILKLLHKRDNVAETIYDYLGVRIVTARLCDVMVAVKLLHKLNMISYPNCYPARARNTLVDYGRFRSQIETLRDMLTAGSISPEEFETMVARLTAAEEATPSSNPHSSASYRSIQLTGRQLIHVRNERFEWLDKLKREISGRQMPLEVMRILHELEYLVDGWYSIREARDGNAHFFPFEVQIMDQEAHAQATSGDANHDRYKLSQIRAARKRVLSKVLELHKVSTSAVG